MSWLFEKFQMEMSSDSVLKHYLSDSVTEIGTSKEGRVVIVFDFAPTVEPAGSGFDRLSKLIVTSLGHVIPNVRRSGPKHHIVFTFDLFDVRLTYTGVVATPEQRMNIEDTPGGLS